MIAILHYSTKGVLFIYFNFNIQSYINIIVRREREMFKVIVVMAT